MTKSLSELGRLRDEHDGEYEPLPPRPARVVLPSLEEVDAAIEANTNEMRRLRKIRRFLLGLEE